MNDFKKMEACFIYSKINVNKNINFLSHFFENGRVISWVNIKNEYELTNDMFFQWVHLKHTIPTRWKTLISNDSDIGNNNLCQNHRVIKGARIFSTDKLSFKETYSFLISNIVKKPTSNSYFKKLFENTTLDLSKIYLLLHLATIDTT